MCCHTLGEYATSTAVRITTVLVPYCRPLRNTVPYVVRGLTPSPTSLPNIPKENIVTRVFVCLFGLSQLPKSTPTYVLIQEQ
jgi:hypothetical protein